MLRSNPSFTQRLQIAADLALVTLALAGAVLSEPSLGPDVGRRYFILAPAVLALWHVCLRLAGLYDVPRAKPPVTALKLLAVGAACTWAQSLALEFAGWLHADQLVSWEFPAAAVVLLGAARLVSAGLMRELRRWGFDAERVLIAGDDARAVHYAQRMREYAPWGQQLYGFLRVSEGRPAPDLAPLRGSLADLEAILAAQPIDRVVFSIPAGRSADLERGLRTCEELGIAAVVLPPLENLHIARPQSEDFYGLATVTYQSTPRQVGQLVAKQVMDAVFSALALLVLAPLFLLVAAAVRLDTPGPIFFRQRRVGLNGRTFFCYKFRTMHVDAEAQLARLRAFNEMSGPVFKMKNDPRITRVGRILRKFSIDELPQFINVFVGDMSLVGPRPPLPSEVAHYAQWQRRRLSVKPGLTCIWQVSGRNNIDFDAWMKLDLEYIDGWSLPLDCKLLLKTIPAVFRGTGH